MAEEEVLMDNAEREALEAKERKDISLTLDTQHERRIAWWRKARVGLFVHWGPYSHLGGVWKGEEVKAAYAEHIQLKGKIPVKDYEAVVREWNPDRFNADQWVKAAKAAGMKYIVVTTKHHDGFAMYDSEVSDYNIVEFTPFGRDPMKELAEACRREGVVLCFYYSHSMDWHHPDSQGNTLDYPGNIGAYDEVESWIGDEDKRERYERYLQEKAFPQIRELLTNYGPVGVLWFDCGHKLTVEQGQRFVDLVHSLQPDCLVNRRVWKEPLGDYGNTMDNQPHVRVPRQDWESIATLNDSWGYKASDNNWKSAKEIIHNLIDVVSMSGNFLINIGPQGDGAIDESSMGLLQEIGQWMERNGASVYETAPSPIGKPPWGRCTQKEHTLYLHVWDWPQNGELLLPGLGNKIESVSWLAAGAELPELKAERINEQDWLIHVPSESPDPIAAVIQVTYSGDPLMNPLKRLYSKQYPNVFPAFEGDLNGSTLRFDTGKKGKDVVTDWKSADDVIRWSFRAAETGSYKLHITYGADAQEAGGSFTVTSGGREWTAEVQSTGGWYQYATVELGNLEIAAPGTYSLEVKAKAISGTALMNLRNLILTPVRV